MKRETARLVMGIVGVALLVGFFMPWVDAGGVASASGWELVDAMRGEGWTSTRVVLALVPLAGAALLGAALLKARWLELLSVGTGLGLCAFGTYKVVRVFFAVSGVGLWMVVAAAVLAVMVPLLTARSR
jgi:hypothetical protein